MHNSNYWNKIRYTIYSPVYDLVAVNFYKYRKKSISLLDIKKGNKILIVGAGTGLDLVFFEKDVEIFAGDITPAMVNKLKVRAEKLKLNVQAEVMDGQNLRFQNQEFDFVILHLILAVIPDAEKTIKEAERVLKPGGKISVFDKFDDNKSKTSILKNILNPVTEFLFSNINRKLSEIISVTNLKIIHQEIAAFYGWFKIYILQK